MITTDWTYFKHGIYRLDGRHILVHANKMVLPKGYLVDGKPVNIFPLGDYTYAFTVRVKKSLKVGQDGQRHQDGTSL